MTRKIVAVAALAVFAFAVTGCIGSMALTGKVRQFNLGVSPHPWPREGVFVVLQVLPVYSFAGAIDLLVVNSIEFWTGTNPISNEKALVTVAWAGHSHREVAEDGTVAVSTLREDGSIDVRVSAPDGRTSSFNVQATDEELIARDAEGHEYGSVRRDQL